MEAQLVPGSSWIILLLPQSLPPVFLILTLDSALHEDPIIIPQLKELVLEEEMLTVYPLILLQWLPFCHHTKKIFFTQKLPGFWVSWPHVASIVLSLPRESNAPNYSSLSVPA